jgi:hypothetical protein
MSNTPEYQRLYRLKNLDRLKAQKREYYKKNREKVNEKCAKYYKLHKCDIIKKNVTYQRINKDKVNYYRKKRYTKLKANNNGIIPRKPRKKGGFDPKTWKKEYYKNNRDKLLGYNKKYYKTEKGLINQRLGRSRRRARIKNIIHDFTTSEWYNKLKATDGVCCDCNKYIGIDKLTLDHNYPVCLANKQFFKTGKKIIYTINDVTPICISCNVKRRNKILKWGDYNTNNPQNKHTETFCMEEGVSIFQHGQR